MKTAAKIIIIITIIYISVMTVLGLFGVALTPFMDFGLDGATFALAFFTSYFATMLIMCILVIVFGCIALKKLKAPGKPSIAISVLTLLFCNTIAGILMLCTPEDKAPEKIESAEEE